MNLTLDRFAYSPLGTFGKIEELGVYPVERPWEDNKTGISCIPEGKYVCRRVNSPRFGNVFEVTNVPGRTQRLQAHEIAMTKAQESLSSIALEQARRTGAIMYIENLRDAHK